MLVTGAAGFIGSHLCEQLLAEGHSVIGVDGFVDSYPRWRKEANLAPMAARDGFEFVEADLRTSPLARILRGVDVVVNEAAMVGLTRSWREMDFYASCNLIGLQRLLEASRAAEVSRFIQISTSSVYGRAAVGDETVPTLPVSPYGVTKLAAEHLVVAYMQTFGVPVVILRYFSVYGPRQRPDMAYNRFIEQLRRGEAVTVFDDGGQTRSNTYVDDCVRGTIQAIEGATPGEIYNIGGGQKISVLQAIGVISEAMGVKPRIVFSPTQPGDQRHTAADTSKAGAAFGYRPAVTPELGLRLQVAWQTDQVAVGALAGQA